ncbi:hypothetical protein KIN20_025588 [Parelaphostrongylus tenuis]|uniref:Uncharacterized protein n=1 Tax=Parelaphostrongylus tenuis TaxID=148309 RepID=A0AAD5QXB0_PARTN|nr:hypothetical protein KIN20_025588 [Parelaphostrongylus tenuis]
MTPSSPTDAACHQLLTSLTGLVPSGLLSRGEKLVKPGCWIKPMTMCAYKSSSSNP